MTLLPEMRNRRLVLSAAVGTCLNVECFRGFAPARILAEISRPDTYLQYVNPDGTQRDLSPEKARNAYRYIAGASRSPEHDSRFFTEVVLNVRDKSLVRVERRCNGMAVITIYLEKLQECLNAPGISRVEGNHRLALVAGSDGFLPVDITISFCITIGVSRKMEAKLFRDINSNQRPMNTSHLDSIDVRLGRRAGKPVSEHLRIADRLASDPDSPFLDLVYRGGRRPIGSQFAVSLRTLSNLSRLIVSRSGALQSLSLDLQYARICEFWRSVADLFPQEWNDSARRYVMMKSAGLSALAMLGASVIDIAVDGRPRRNLKDVLAPISDKLDWSTGGPMQGLNGLGGAKIIFDRFLVPSLLQRQRSSSHKAAKGPI